MRRKVAGHPLLLVPGPSHLPIIIDRPQSQTRLRASRATAEVPPRASSAVVCRAS